MSVRQMTVESVYNAYENQKDEYIWIDVRQPEEWEQGTIPGIRKIMLSELSEHFDELDKSKKYMMVCRSGGRSGRAAEAMQDAGFKDVTNFDGGMLAWNEEGHPTT